ncbi:uncharacterized protein LOC113294721 [Papaver somniferum]|uniref:uncharacterized protein LOC113294721 n=1 Tax=Papaver somniferum TaxID=3469 RepID=UPI000E6F5F8B|nr:uncharacterized protein LOC113294721 [Papaver somniferum]
MALGNNYWCNSFPQAKLMHLVQAGSDHCPILLIPQVHRNNSWRPFKFFAMWMKHLASKTQLFIAWATDVSGSAGFQLLNKQHSTRKRLSQWNKIEFGDIDRNINNLQTQLEIAQNDPNPISQHENIVTLTRKLDDWFNIKADFYKQKSGDTFITEMDQNTKYFHTLANRRMFRKNIECLCDNNGIWYNQDEDMASLLVNHFEQVSKTSNPNFTDITFDIIPTVITAQDNSQLNRIPSSDENFQTIKNMNDWGSPGPDGFQSGFYKYNWDIVGHDVTKAV